MKEIYLRERLLKEGIKITLVLKWKHQKSSENLFLKRFGRKEQLKEEFLLATAILFLEKA